MVSLVSLMLLLQLGSMLLRALMLLQLLALQLVLLIVPVLRLLMLLQALHAYRRAAKVYQYPTRATTPAAWPSIARALDRGLATYLLLGLKIDQTFSSRHRRLRARLDQQDSNLGARQSD